MYKGKHILKRLKVGNFDITFEFCPRASFCGRFGGGWNWKVGVQAGSTSVIFNLLICTIRITHREKKHV